MKHELIPVEHVTISHNFTAQFSRSAVVPNNVSQLLGTPSECLNYLLMSHKANALSDCEKLATAALDRSSATDELPETPA